MSEHGEKKERRGFLDQVFFFDKIGAEINRVIGRYTPEEEEEEDIASSILDVETKAKKKKAKDRATRERARRDAGIRRGSTSTILTQTSTARKNILG